MNDQGDGWLLERDGKVWTFTINRPETRNSLTWEVRGALLETIGAAERGDDCNALVITGAGDKAFCSGGDVGNQLASLDDWPGDTMERLQFIGEIARRILTTRVVVVSAVNGGAFGGGCFMALAADIVIAHKRAQFGFGFAKRGLVPDWAGFFLLPRLVGLAQAKNLVLRGMTLDAQRAYDMGMIAELVDDDVRAKAREVAGEIAAGPRIALAMSKQVLARSFETGLDGMLTYEMLAQTVARRTEDHREGVQSFFEKRPPVFKGK
jgi:2-(1,2-epoxy-1,2-dihydrophenyl)acetyl-CoA isomerase